MPSPESPAKRMMTRSSCTTSFCTLPGYVRSGGPLCATDRPPTLTPMVDLVLGPVGGDLVRRPERAQRRWSARASQARRGGLACCAVEVSAAISRAAQAEQRSAGDPADVTDVLLVSGTVTDVLAPAVRRSGRPSRGRRTSCPSVRAPTAAVRTGTPTPSRTASTSSSRSTSTCPAARPARRHCSTACASCSRRTHDGRRAPCRRDWASARPGRRTATSTSTCPRTVGSMPSPQPATCSAFGGWTSSRPMRTDAPACR